MALLQDSSWRADRASRDDPAAIGELSIASPVPHDEQAKCRFPSSRRTRIESAVSQVARWEGPINSGGLQMD
jgi:hypothetical protein